MKIKAFFFLGSLLLPLTISAHDDAMNAVDNAYRITGDAQAAPVQVFSMGTSIYVQLHDVKDVPAPIGPNGPIDYRIYGPYIILPLISSFDLHYGPYVAHVTAANVSAMSSDIASVDRVVDPQSTVPAALAPQPVLNAAMVAPSALPQPASVAASVSYGADGDKVTGEISTPGSVKTFSAPTQVQAGTTRIAVVASDPVATFSVTRGRYATIRADGTVAGARVARLLMTTCNHRGGICHVSYTGAEAGYVEVIE